MASDVNPEKTLSSPRVSFVQMIDNAAASCENDKGLIPGVRIAVSISTNGASGN